MLGKQQATQFNAGHYKHCRSL